MKTRDGLRPIYGEKVECDMCGKPYAYFIWAFGSDELLCSKCLNKELADVVDGIDLDAEHDVITQEIRDQDLKDMVNVMNPKPKSRHKRRNVRIWR